MLAQAEKKGDAFELTRVAAGFAVQVKGQDTIIDSRNTFKAELGAFGKRILTENEKAFEKDVQQLVRTPTMRMIDDRQYLLHEKKHDMLTIRHAILVDPKTGRVSTLVWLLAPKADENTLAEPEMQLLPEGLREKYAVSIKPKGFNFIGIPDEDTFARITIPQGKAVPFTPALKKLAVLKDYNREQAIDLENALREAAAAGKP